MLSSYWYDKNPANLVDDLLQQFGKRCQKCCHPFAISASKIATHVKTTAMYPATFLCDVCAVDDDACQELPEAKLVRAAIKYMHTHEMLT